jgi:hypothetical protein
VNTFHFKNVAYAGSRNYQVVFVKLSPRTRDVHIGRKNISIRKRISENFGAFPLKLTPHPRGRIATQN